MIQGARLWYSYSQAVRGGYIEICRGIMGLFSAKTTIVFTSRICYDMSICTNKVLLFVEK